MYIKYNFFADLLKDYLIFVCFFTYLAALGLSCGTRDVWSSLRCAESFFLLLVGACAIYFPVQGSNLGTLHWECRVLAIGPPRKPLVAHNDINLM